MEFVWDKFARECPINGNETMAEYLERYDREVRKGLREMERKTWKGWYDRKVEEFKKEHGIT